MTPVPGDQSRHWPAGTCSGSALLDQFGSVRNLGTLAPILQECFGHEDRAYWVAALEAAGVPCGPINTVAEVFEDPQVRFRQMRIKLTHPLAGNIPLVGSPMVFTRNL